MSKKTNAEKMARARAEKQKRRLIRRRHPRGRLNPLNIKAMYKRVPFSASTAESLVDLALGQGFVQFLRAIGVRDKITELVFNADDGDAAEGSD